MSFKKTSETLIKGSHTLDQKYYLNQDILDQESTPNMAIPKDNSNRHYQEYLDWVDAGNTPDPAD